jgi:penicillin-binding protein 2
VKTNHPLARRRRARGVYGVIVLLMGVLGAVFFRVQVLRSSVWTLRAESNRLRPLMIPAPRGTIYDREGRILADNVPGYAITLLPAPPDSVRATLDRMRQYVNLSDAAVERLLRTLRRYGRQRLVLDADADFEMVSRLEEHRTEFPGVFIEMTPRRRYLAGAAASHVLGYVGEITESELGSSAFADDRYSRGMIVGKTGIEKEYESMLHGRSGLRYVEVDAKGRIVGDFGGFPTDPAVPGTDIRLNLDIELQAWIDRIFPDSLSGAVVALDPTDGGVLALYSAPTFDPNAFIGGIDAIPWRRLSTDERRPLFNRAVMGLYPPASTWKLATAAIALERGVITPDETMPEPCTGSFWWGNREWHCWKRTGHGFLKLAGAIAHSCDVYFYQLGLKLGLQGLIDGAITIGFDSPTGIDLPQESAGVFPESKEFWVRRWGYNPTEGEALSLAIGQGPNSQTPLKIAQFYLALARDGSAPPPTLAQGVELGSGWSLDLTPENLEALREGLRRVTAPGGTAHIETTLEKWDLIGKTGTAEHALSQAGLARTHAWFAGMAGPRGAAPEIVVVALLEYGGGGSGTAARIVAKTADFYLRRKYGIPVDTIQTLGEYLRTSGWPAWYRRPEPASY